MVEGCGWLGGRGSVDGVATVPCSQRAESFGDLKKKTNKKTKKKRLCKPQRPLLDDGVNAQGQLQHWDRWGKGRGLRRPAGLDCS